MIPKGKPHNIDWEKAKELGKKILEDEREPKPSKWIKERANEIYKESYDKYNLVHEISWDRSNIKAILEYLDTKDS